MTRARILRLERTKQNRNRARLHVQALTLKYRAVKDGMISGAVDKKTFEDAYNLTARQIATYREEWRSRQRAIEDQYKVVLQR